MPRNIELYNGTGSEQDNIDDIYRAAEVLFSTGLLNVSKSGEYIDLQASSVAPKVTVDKEIQAQSPTLEPVLIGPDTQDINDGKSPTNDRTLSKPDDTGMHGLDKHILNQSGGKCCVKACVDMATDANDQNISKSDIQLHNLNNEVDNADGCHVQESTDLSPIVYDQASGKSDTLMPDPSGHKLKSSEERRDIHTPPGLIPLVSDKTLCKSGTRIPAVNDRPHGDGQEQTDVQEPVDLILLATNQTSSEPYAQTQIHNLNSPALNDAGEQSRAHSPGDLAQVVMDPGSTKSNVQLSVTDSQMSNSPGERSPVNAPLLLSRLLNKYRSKFPDADRKIENVNGSSLSRESTPQHTASATDLANKKIKTEPVTEPEPVTHFAVETRPVWKRCLACSMVYQSNDVTERIHSHGRVDNHNEIVIGYDEAHDQSFQLGQATDLQNSLIKQIWLHNVTVQNCAPAQDASAKRVDDIVRGTFLRNVRFDQHEQTYTLTTPRQPSTSTPNVPERQTINISTSKNHVISNCSCESCYRPRDSSSLNLELQRASTSPMSRRSSSTSPLPHQPTVGNSTTPQQRCSSTPASQYCVVANCTCPSCDEQRDRTLTMAQFRSDKSQCMPQLQSSSISTVSQQPVSSASTTPEQKTESSSASQYYVVGDPSCPSCDGQAESNSPELLVFSTSSTTQKQPNSVSTSPVCVTGGCSCPSCDGKKNNLSPMPQLQRSTPTMLLQQRNGTPKTPYSIIDDCSCSTCDENRSLTSKFSRQQSNSPSLTQYCIINDCSNPSCGGQISQNKKNRRKNTARRLRITKESSEKDLVADEDNGSQDKTCPVCHMTYFPNAVTEQIHLHKNNNQRGTESVRSAQLPGNKDAEDIQWKTCQICHLTYYVNEVTERIHKHYDAPF